MNALVLGLLPVFIRQKLRTKSERMWIGAAEWFADASEFRIIKSEDLRPGLEIYQVLTAKRPEPGNPGRLVGCQTKLILEEEFVIRHKEEDKRCFLYHREGSPKDSRGSLPVNHLLDPIGQEICAHDDWNILFLVKN